MRGGAGMARQEEPGSRACGGLSEHGEWKTAERRNVDAMATEQEATTTTELLPK
jgi:hypothetical protein